MEVEAINFETAGFMGGKVREMEEFLFGTEKRKVMERLIITG